MESRDAWQKREELFPHAQWHVNTHLLKSYFFRTWISSYNTLQPSLMNLEGFWVQKI